MRRAANSARSDRRSDCRGDSVKGASRSGRVLTGEARKRRRDHYGVIMGRDRHAVCGAQRDARGAEAIRRVLEPSICDSKSGSVDLPMVLVGSVVDSMLPWARVCMFTEPVTRLPKCAGAQCRQRPCLESLVKDVPARARRRPLYRQQVASLRTSRPRLREQPAA